MQPRGALTIFGRDYSAMQATTVAMPSRLIEFQRRCDFTHAPYVHPRDRTILESKDDRYIGGTSMIWHVIYEGPDGQVQSCAARSRDQAIHIACELLQQSRVVRRVIGPNGSVIERAELDGHYDEGRFPGLQRAINLPR